MQPINQEPIFADFANCDVDGAVRLITDGTLADIKRLGLTFTVGRLIWLTDNDVEVIGTLARRGETWVAIPDPNGYKSVPEDAPYHINNLSK